MRPVRSALVLALVVSAIAGTSASAAIGSKPPGTVTVTDQGGDANAINSQGYPTVPATTVKNPAGDAATGTPVQVAGADIVSMTYGATYTTKTVKKKPVYTVTGLKVVMTLAAPPQPNVIFRATPTVANLCTTFQFSYAKYVNGTETSGLRHNCPGFQPALPTDGYEATGVDSVLVAGSTITWTLRVGKMLPVAIKPGVVFETLSGHTRFYAGAPPAGGATVPVLDEVYSAATYKFGK